MGGEGAHLFLTRRLLTVVWLLGVVAMASSAAGTSAVSRKKLAVKRHLKRLNKKAVKSIESPDGDIIDCVLMYDQPAFDHPLLKDHKIQMRPRFHPGGLFDEKKVTALETETTRARPAVSQLWHSTGGECPDGTVPIRRTKGEDVLRASSVRTYGKKKHSTTMALPNFADLNDQHMHQHAIVYVTGDAYYGARAFINVWQPAVEQESNEFSLSQIWLLGGSFFDGDLNSIEAGWQVDNQLYGDNNTRLFIYWTNDSYSAAGCYNLACAGFVQTSKQIVVGAAISPVSVYDSNQYDITILVWKEPKTGLWWLLYGNDSVIGYWPDAIFTHLVDSATTIEWGGEVVNSNLDGYHTTTQMGSGHFSSEGFSKASYFKNIQIIDANNNFRDPKDPAMFTESPGCYDLVLDYNKAWGHHFYYGGPGKNADCP